MLNWPLAALSIALVGICVGCDDPPKPVPLGETPAPTATPAPIPKAPPDPLADLTVDELGPFLQGHRVDMSAKDADEKLGALVQALPVRDKVVPIAVTRNAKTQYVAAFVRSLGALGAQEIDIKTPGRSGGDAVLKLTPEAGVPPAIPGCAVVAMIKKDSTSTVWRLQGGTAAKFSKGLAGPDMSMTYEGMKAQMGSCSASTWFLAGEDNVIWGLVFDLGQIVAKADPPPKATRAALLSQAPVAGRPVVLKRPKT